METIILTPVVTVLVEMLGSATMEKLGSLWGVEDDLEDLKESLSSIEAVLLDAEEKQSHNHQVRLWLQRLEDVVEDTDDLFDEVSTEELRRQWTTSWMKKEKIFFSSSNQFLFRYKMAKEIRSVKNKLAKIAADRKYFQLVESRRDIVRPVRSGRETHSFVVEENIVGRDEDKIEVLKLMFSPESRDAQERVSVIPIVGMGGLGKTTLVQLVFNDAMVKEHFEPRIWVCVSDDFDERTIVGKIVQSMYNICTKDDTLENLQKILREKTDGKRYFLVLDDVWSEDREKWQNVKDLLLNYGEFGSTIVITTRNLNVARLSSRVQPYHLGILGEDDSWSLFKKLAFKRGRNPADSSIEEIRTKIVKKCGGIPLAIRMMVGMLSELDSETKWSVFLDKELSSMTQKDGEILPILRLSYNCLPSSVKRCFAYCSLFPKDDTFDVEALVTLWIANGFIGAPLDGSQSLEDVGYNYFLELGSRFFFQELELDETLDKIVRCKMHDLVHDLAIHVGGDKYARLDHTGEGSALKKARHVSLSWRESMQSSLLQAKKIRSLIRPRTYSCGESKFCGDLALDFSLLRMLDLHNSDISKMLISIGKLKHLRYLDLSENNMVTSLPRSITKLVNLQTLKLTGCEKLCELPRDIVELRNLRHLTWTNKKIILPSGVSQLTNLRTLSCLRLSKDPTRIKLDELSGLNNLRGYLKIKDIQSGIQVNGDILKEKNHLQYLQLRWYNPDCYVADQEVEKTLDRLRPNLNLRALTVKCYNGIRYSDWLSSLTNLVEIRLVSCLKLKLLPSLESLCSLRKMYVRGCDEMEYIVMDLKGDGDSSYLCSLLDMNLLDLPSFKGWKHSDVKENEVERVPLFSYFPHLTSLQVINCPKLVSMPLYPDVKKLWLEDTDSKPFEQTASVYIANPQISQTQTPITTNSSFPSSSSTSSFYPLFQVKKLDLCCPKISYLQYLPDWMQSFSCLKTLEINKSKSFSLDGETMKWIIKECDEHQMSIENQTTWEIFLSIRMLVLQAVPILEFVSLAAQYFTSLEKLKIIHAIEDLDFSWEDLPIMHNVNLKCLHISRCNTLSTIPNWICKLYSLQRLEISWCHKLESLPTSLSSLTSLQTLHIKFCSILTLDDEIVWEALVCLQSLTLCVLPKLVTLPGGLQYATTLQTLQLKECKNLTAIPDWICNLSSLQQLHISKCPKIESLPGSIKSLTSLHTLWINDCPSLSERCRRDTGEDWPNLCHINNINTLD